MSCHTPSAMELGEAPAPSHVPETDIVVKKESSNSNDADGLYQSVATNDLFDA